MNLLIIVSYFLTLLFHCNLYKYTQRGRCLPIRRSCCMVVLSACIAWGRQVITTSSKPLGVGMHKSWFPRVTALAGYGQVWEFFLPLCNCLILVWIRLLISAAAHQPGCEICLSGPSKNYTYAYRNMVLGCFGILSALSIKTVWHRYCASFTHLQKQYNHTCRHKHQEQLHSYQHTGLTIIMVSTWF